MRVRHRPSVYTLASPGPDYFIAMIERGRLDFTHVTQARVSLGSRAAMSDVTQVLERVQRGDPRAAEELLPLVYGELRELAARRMARELPGHTLQPTALVHEAWLRLAATQNTVWNGRAHFFGAAAEAMRRILVEHARRKGAQRHGGGQSKMDLDQIQIAAPARDEELLALSEALEQFTQRDHRKAELVKLRYFAGFTTEEAAEILGISVPTADRWWRYSRAWLSQEIEHQRNSAQI